MFENRWRIKGKGHDENIRSLCRDFFEAGVMLASGGYAATTLEFRSEKFRNEVMAFTEYPQDLLIDFYNYWSEPNRSNTKMRFELQKTWQTKRRLVTWAKNDFNNYGKQQSDSKRFNKLADILTD